MTRVVINIPDFIYDALKENPDCGTVNFNHIVAQGTVLPEGHGDLISRSELKKALQKLEEEPDYQHEGETWQNGLYMAESLIDDAPTVNIPNPFMWDFGTKEDNDE